MNTTQKNVCGLRLVGLLLLAALLIFPGAIRAAETTSESFTNSNEALRSYLVLQEQLRATQQALERNRKETEELAAKNTEAVETKFKELEKAMNGQRLEEWNSMQATVRSNNRLMLIVGGSIAGVGFFVLLVTGCLQWRSVNRLAEVSAQVQGSRMALPPTVSAGAAQLLGAGETGQSNDRLFGALTQLEKRILELEHTTHPAIETPALTAGTATANTNGSDPLLHDTNAAHDSVLLAKGQSLLNLDKPTEALACFEEILKLEPNHGEALVKKGIALETLQKPEEALACYDQAIAANADLTIAYLQKGGLFNRLERYEEALQCYELALHAQEKVHAA
jgi:tetratricopeptide (TPR) repeat protein